ncbi:Eco57I restriction-modification methylase domain-containing protein [Streptococcus sanguinis]|jgi:adenine/cytosine DNA methyltransferase|uniref:Eco57I restriction-modification methylase domain-containing protein n=1 Tax=Streptococcus sanguinis TaxID=1305 RepID=UPI003D05C886
MKLTEQQIKRIINDHNLNHREDVIEFINKNPDDLDLQALSRIAELVNNGRINTSAYYTDGSILTEIEKYLPKINKSVIKIIEPSAGVGNFLEIIIKKYSYAKKLIIQVNDIDRKSIELLKALNKHRNIPDNVEIIYSNEDFLSSSFPNFETKYDLAIGNPPFTKLNKKNGLLDYSIIFNDNNTTNLSGFFLQKCMDISDRVVMILPKYFLNAPDFLVTRNRTKAKKIERILDFGEKGFKGVLIETIALYIDMLHEADKTISYSLTKDIENVQNQQILTSSAFPSWLLYRNDFFNEIASKMKFDIFDVFRDRQLTNSILKISGEVPVIKSRNILRDGSSIISINGYDSFIDKNEIEKYAVGKYFEREDVYLSPNMTYYPRVIKKPKNTLINGSVAVLINKSNLEIKKEHIDFLCSETFERFYSIARNYSTRSLNIDKNSVKFFGLYYK